MKLTLAPRSYLRFSAVISAVFISLSVPSVGHTYFSTIDTGEVVENGKYQLSTEGQVTTGSNSGFNFVGRFDAGVSDDSSVRVLLGTGKVNTQMGLFYKIVPIPDTDTQPALGVLGGVVYAKQDDLSTTSIRVHPMVSKKFNWEYGLITPYASLPTGLSFSNSKTVVPLQLALGAEFRPLSFDYVSFMTEVGFNLVDAFGYVSVAAVIAFDPQHGIQIK